MLFKIKAVNTFWALQLFLQNWPNYKNKTNINSLPHQNQQKITTSNFVTCGSASFDIDLNVTLTRLMSADDFKSSCNHK